MKTPKAPAAIPPTPTTLAAVASTPKTATKEKKRKHKDVAPVAGTPITPATGEKKVSLNYNYVYVFHDIVLVPRGTVADPKLEEEEEQGLEAARVWESVLCSSSLFLSIFLGRHILIGDVPVVMGFLG